MTVWNRKIVEITSIPKADMQGRIIDDIFENVEPQAAVSANTLFNIKYKVFILNK